MERHNVCHCAQRHQVGIVLHQRLRIALKRGGQIERNSHSCQITEGAGAVQPVGVDDCSGVRQCFPGAVMVCNHQIKPERGGVFRFLQGADPVVHRDDELRVALCHLVDGGAVQAIALGFPLGNIIKNIRSLCFEVGIEHRSGGHAIRIVIPVDGDPLKIVQGLSNPRGGLVHIRQAHGVEFHCVRF